MASIMRLGIFILTLAGITWARKGKNDFFTVSFNLYPKDHGHVPGGGLKIDPGLLGKCVEFSAIYNLTAPSRPETIYFPPEPVPPEYDLRLFQDYDCSKPIYEDGWPWESSLEGERWDYVTGLYRLTMAEPIEIIAEPQLLKPVAPPGR
ncbi:hypothetical protein TWF102_010765 [Orbilia oligospora]|uniref:Uncharacterized protein n=1 Tax=Orbilia oligospora TaxID=2813651 RepID=A0A7C8JH29_ORBOL|nr:hypothetical protein TWF102_010765 [Orbilia oligospora]KAF3111527.1 hypothetical protein TWF103_003475 [Orbilia oligospora]KAF3147920.1 hypothetical protein TWF594_001852 [Orbilia oligospora]